MNPLTREILNPTQIKAGLSIGEDDHTVYLYHRGVPIRQYNSHVMSRDQIIRDADEYIMKKLNPSLGDTMARTGRFGK
jgi:hypothetical protein